MASRRKTNASMKHKNLHANSISPPPTLRTRNTKENSSQRIEKIQRPRRTSPRLQERLLNTLSSLEPPREPSNECDEWASSRQETRERGCEKKMSLPSENSKKARLANPARISVSVVPEKPQPLTANNLKRHILREGFLDKLELINPEADKNCWIRGSESSASVVRPGIASTSTGD